MNFSASNDLQIDPNLIVDDTYLINNFRFSKSFINQHACAMGSFGRPRKFFLRFVLNHLENLAMNSINKVHSKNNHKRDMQRKIDNVVKLTLTKAKSK
jgi:hypothetical protein